MYVLERKQLYIVPEPMLKNRTCQSYRWKQIALCEDAAPLEKMLNSKKHREDYRIIPLADSVEQEGTP